MKKKTIYNLLMVVIIVAIVAGGVLGVGHIKGWFDKAGDGAVLQQIVGVVRMERGGVNFVVKADTVLRPGDKISAQTGATATITVGNGYVTLGGGAELTVVDAEDVNLHLTAGELFINAEEKVRVTFDKGEENLENHFGVQLSTAAAGNANTVQIDIADATAGISYRVGAQTVRVFRGSVDDIAAGQEKEYVGGKTTVSQMHLESLNDFVVAQIRKANTAVSLCFTNKDLDDLALKRKQEIQDMLNGIKPEHEHSYDVKVIGATCTEPGCTEYRCACGKYYTDSQTPATGHSFGQWELVKEATTEESGLMERQCSKCQVKEEKVIEPVEVDHTHSYVKEVVNPTCTEKGYTVYTCTCGDSYRDEEIPAPGHKYEKKVVKPTCTVQGYTLYTCACGHSYMDNISLAKGHGWSDWTVVKEATVDEEGLQERICNVCQEKQQQTIDKKNNVGYVYLTIRCDTILDNMDILTPGKEEFVPADGIILPTVQVAIFEGDTVFDVLVRVCEKTGIQLEYKWTMYETYYVEGINHLYEFDCGGQSGWMFKVNEWFPNYGISGYKVSNGDAIVFCYTCRGLGNDVGAPEWEGHS